MKRLHVFLAYLFLVCCVYISFYEGMILNTSYDSTPNTILDFFYIYSIAQGIAAGFYLVVIGLSLYNHKIEWDMIELQERRKFEARYKAKIENLLNK